VSLLLIFTGCLFGLSMMKILLRVVLCSLLVAVCGCGLLDLRQTRAFDFKK